MRPAARAGAVAAALLALVVGRVLVEGRAALREGEAAVARGDVDRGVRALRRAAHWYAPGSPYSRAAYDALERLARDREAHGQSEQALAAWRAIRASALATRWLVTPEADRLRRANRRIARLMALQPPPPEEREVPVARREERHLALLQEDRAPEPAWVVVMGVGLALWLGAAAWATRNGWDDDDRARPRALGIAGGCVALGFALFALALWRA